MATLEETGILMQARLILSALFIAGVVPRAEAQQFQTQAQPTPAPAKPKLAAPKPKPAAEKKTASAVTVKARLIEKIGDWSVFMHEDVNGRVCFAAAAPSDMQPKAAKRTSVVFYITSWPKDGVRNEVSIRLGYAIKANSTASVTAGGQRFALPGEDDKAFTKDTAEERKLLAAMAAGGAMVVKATSAKGTATTDQYSLEGASAAVQKLQLACP